MSAGQPQRTWALLAAAGALVLLGSMFLEWYTLELPEGVREPRVDLPTFTAFEGLERADVAIVVAAALAIALAGALLAGALARSPAPAVALVAVSLFALAVVVYRGVISPPGLVILGFDFDMNVSFGWFVSLVSSMVMVGAGMLAYLAGPRLELEREEPAPPRAE
jgi:hypothetical protein